MPSSVIPVLLLILDGFGYREATDFNAIAQARKPNWDRLWNEYPHTFIHASEAAVGLPKGQMGNSEVGHLNIGAGRVVYQEYTRIDRAIQLGHFRENPALLETIAKAKQAGGALHIFGLLSDGGVHSHVGWAKVMKDFHMTFNSADMGGIAMDMRMPQNWKDQDVFNLGFAYKTSPAVTLRAGMNLANNPVPDTTVNPLFPATIKNHYTGGVGYAMDKVSEINVSATYVPRVTVTAPAAAGGYSIDHSQLNWQFMYTHRF